METSIRKSSRKTKSISFECDSNTPVATMPLSMDDFLRNLGPEFKIEQVARDTKVQFYTGFEGTEVFKYVFDHLLLLASRMQYWKGDKTTEKEQKNEKDVAYEEELYAAGLARKRPGPKRKLALEQEFLIVMMRLKVDLLVQDLAYRFEVSVGLVTSVFFTWVRLTSLEFKHLIKWVDREIVRRHHPDMFRKYYPKCCVIIDCTEIFIGTPSSLEFAAACCSEYKHHHTVKFLVGITPNGVVSFLSGCYGGRTTDVYITKDCRIANKLLPGDQVMADRGFKIKDHLAYYQCSLAIPPSTQGDMQMSKDNVNKTSQIANVRIFVEKAIRRMKGYQILKNELPINLLPLADDIVTICAAFTNLKEPLYKQ